MTTITVHGSSGRASDPKATTESEAIQSVSDELIQRLSAEASAWLGSPVTKQSLDIESLKVSQPFETRTTHMRASVIFRDSFRDDPTGIVPTSLSIRHAFPIPLDDRRVRFVFEPYANAGHLFTRNPRLAEECGGVVVDQRTAEFPAERVADAWRIILYHSPRPDFTTSIILPESLASLSEREQGLLLLKEYAPKLFQRGGELVAAVHGQTARLSVVEDAVFEHRFTREHSRAIPKEYLLLQATLTFV